MTSRPHRNMIVGILSICVVALTAASVASGGPAAAKQRVSFVGTFNTNTGSGNWRLIPLSAGPLKPDSGTLSGSGNIVRRLVRNGQRVDLIVGGDSLTGRHGAFGISQRVESTDVGRRYSADIGTWTFTSGVGVYARVSGGCRCAAVGLPSGVVLVNQEGWLTVR